ncbi:MAG: ubiquinol-cytochrome C chaperone family protein [Pseudomonadota bacterium]
MPFRLFSSDRRQRERIAHSLYLAILAQARQPTFYADLGVPDTVDGRFDLIVAHAFLVMRRLGRVEGGKDLSQALFDLMFADMDQQLREMGVTDLAVGRKVRQMAEAFYGRVAAYEKGMAAGREALAEAVARNLYRAEDPAAAAHAGAMADHLVAAEARLAAQADADLVAGRISFAEPS